MSLVKDANAPGSGEYGKLRKRMLTTDSHRFDAVGSLFCHDALLNRI